MKKKLLSEAIIIAVLLTGCTAQIKDNSQNPPVPHSGTVTADPLHSRTVPEAHTIQETGESPSMITEEEARQIALSHAGLSADQVTFAKSHMDRDDGLINYDIEFYTGDHKEYDYEIDPYSGKILDYDYDAEYDDAPFAPAPEQSSSAAESAVSADDAKQIALDKVPGAAAKDIVKFEEEYDDGRLIYEGEIHYEKKEYDFEIDGATGKILEWDAEPLHDR